MLANLFYTLHHWLRPSLVALFHFRPGLTWNIRWRLLLMQPISIITYSISKLPYILSSPFTVEWLPVAPGRQSRVLVYKNAGTGKGRRLRPIHIDIHGGAFIGGHAESNAPVDERIARETGAVVLGITYRFAPEHVFPTAIDDVDAVIAYIREHAEERWGADPNLITIGGFSAGGNMALAATQQPACHAPSPTAFKACILYYGVLDVRLSPQQKPKSEGMPDKDPTEVLMPIFDSYAAEARKSHLDDPRLSPELAARDTLPQRLLLVMPSIDILVAEELRFVQRINEEDETAGQPGRVELMVEEGQMHGYLELPDLIVKPEIKDRAWQKSIDFLREVYSSHGWTWESQ